MDLLVVISYCGFLTLLWHCVSIDAHMLRCLTLYPPKGGDNISKIQVLSGSWTTPILWWVKSEKEHYKQDPGLDNTDSTAHAHMPYQVSRNLKPSKCSFCDGLRLVQSQSTGASFFVTRAEGIDARVEAANKTIASTLKAHFVFTPTFAFGSANVNWTTACHFWIVCALSIWRSSFYAVFPVLSCSTTSRLERKVWPWAGALTGVVNQRGGPKFMHGIEATWNTFW